MGAPFRLPPSAFVLPTFAGFSREMRQTRSTQGSVQIVLIFRLLLKITVERLRECVSFYFLSPQGVHAYDECNPCFRSVQSANNGQPANESSFQWFKTSPDFALPLTWISHVVSPKRLGGDRVFAIALSALTTR